VANAASFVLPISNAADLVIYSAHMPVLMDWLGQFGLPSVAAIVATYLVLRLSQRWALRQELAGVVAVPPVSAAALVAAAGIGVAAVGLMLASWRGEPLGLTCAAVALVTLATVVVVYGRASPLPVPRHISWGVLPLVAGLSCWWPRWSRPGWWGN
jgi:arsenical pump membrane protein